MHHCFRRKRLLHRTMLFGSQDLHDSTLSSSQYLRYLKIWCCYLEDYGRIYRTMIRNVKLILGPIPFLHVGRLCSQFSWVVSFITSKLPCSSTAEIISLVCLCLNKKRLSAPKLKDAIGVHLPILFSSSLCQPMPSLPSWYKLSKHELNSVPTSVFIFF